MAVTRESVHQLRVSFASLLLGVSATAHLRLFELPFVHPMVGLLVAMLLFPRSKTVSTGKSGNVLIPFCLIVALNVAKPWWLEKTGQPIEDSPWLIVPLYFWALSSLSLDAAKTIRILPASPSADSARDTNAI